MKYNTMFLVSDMHGACGCASQTPQAHSISHTKLTPGWVLIQVNFDPIQDIGPKVGVGALSRDYSI